jgi:hypothetical protein
MSSSSSLARRTPDLREDGPTFWYASTSHCKPLAQYTAIQLRAAESFKRAAARFWKVSVSIGMASLAEVLSYPCPRLRLHLLAPARALGRTY